MIYELKVIGKRDAVEGEWIIATSTLLNGIKYDSLTIEKLQRCHLFAQCFGIEAREKTALVLLHTGHFYKQFPAHDMRIRIGQQGHYYDATSPRIIVELGRSYPDSMYDNIMRFNQSFELTNLENLKELTLL